MEQSQFIPEMYDYGAMFRTQAMKGAYSFGLMPNSPLIKKYDVIMWGELMDNTPSTKLKPNPWAVSYTDVPYVLWLRYRAKIEPDESVAMRVKGIPEWQKVNRQKALSIAWSPLQAHELDKKKYKTWKNQAWIEKNRMPGAIARKIVYIISEETVKRLRVKHDEQAAFLTQHGDKSIHSDDLYAVHWEDLDWTMTDYVQQLFDIIKANFERLPTLSGLFLPVPYSRGIRSRISSHFTFSEKPFSFEGAEDVARIVAFIIIWSAAAYFLTDHQGWYRDIIKAVKEVIEFPYTVDSTLWNGAQCYRNIENAVKQGCVIKCFDGSGWDTFSVQLIGSVISALAVIWDSLANNASGNLLTSLLNSIATLWLWTRQPFCGFLIKLKIKFVVVLSDDFNVICEVTTIVFLGIDDLFEYVEIDSNVLYVLGYSFKSVLEGRSPVICGYHLISERAESRINVRADDWTKPVYKTVEEKHIQEEIDVYVDLLVTGNALGKKGYEWMDIVTKEKIKHTYYSPKEAALAAIDYIKEVKKKDVLANSEKKV